ncbi:NmrA family NAD(P)-binding protein [Actinacidiphila acididurans]|uniref:NmrA family NAD(P)-binding protein n=1 Tax=Actinacidiphila acididurans TaxID=2784346 RepID=A0ABS2TJG6_9ACTN|nr:NmrA family NAD(P)-binding protein [Actinacidiphila acididurans]MBM9503146.1 NmrA family NAD(P)-binding protein [Actinacidiphila acididurans]
MILVTTPGKVGAEAARLLAGRGEAVRILARHPEKVMALKQAGVDVVEGDLDIPATIDAAMKGVTSVVLVSPAVPSHELHVVGSAVRAGVDHVVKVTSKASADSPIARQRGQAEIEAGLLASGLNYTLLRNNFYMQNFLVLGPAIARTSGFGSAAGAGKAGFIDTRDVAAVAAEVAGSPSAHSGRSYLLTGPELLSYADVAEVLSKVLGRQIAFSPRTRAEDTQAMVSAGVPEPIAAMNAHAVSLIAEGDAAWLSDDVPTVLGRPARTFEQFATDHAGVFS